MKVLIHNDFKTELGIVRTYIETNTSQNSNFSESLFVNTANYKIRLEVFELQNEWLPENMSFKTSKGWRWFIEKTNEKNEELTIYCKLLEVKPETNWSHDSGQHLDAIAIENKINIVHIGTEDGEIMQFRAVNQDYMPIRFKDELSIAKSFTEYIDYGFKTVIPELKINEKIYFHFLVATNSLNENKEYNNSTDASTWYAVEKSKKLLDYYLKEQTIL